MPHPDHGSCCQLGGHHGKHRIAGSVRHTSAVIIQFTIPGRPTAWQRTVGKNGVKFTPRSMRTAQDAIRTLCRVAMRGAGPPLVGPLRLEVLCVYAIPPSWPRAKQEAARLGKVWKTTVPDHDNLVKQISDALNGVAYADDAQIVMCQMGKRYGAPERTEVRLTSMDVLCDHSPRSAFKHVVEAARGQDALPGLTVEASNTQSRKALVSK